MKRRKIGNYGSVNGFWLLQTLLKFREIKDNNKNKRDREKKNTFSLFASRPHSQFSRIHAVRAVTRNVSRRCLSQCMYRILRTAIVGSFCFRLLFASFWHSIVARKRRKIIAHKNRVPTVCLLNRDLEKKHYSLQQTSNACRSWNRLATRCILMSSEFYRMRDANELLNSIRNRKSCAKIRHWAYTR